jgi:transposase
VRVTKIKSERQQAARVVHRTHELPSRQRVMLINAIRSHLAEFGIVAPAGPEHVGHLVDRIAEPDCRLPVEVRKMLHLLVDQLIELAHQINQLEAAMAKRCRRDEEAARLMTMPGIGPITASAIVATIPHATDFRSARDFAAWLGLVPSPELNWGKARLGGITKMGDRTIRRLLIIGALSVIR